MKASLLLHERAVVDETVFAKIRIRAQETDTALRRYTAPAVLVLDEIGHLSYATRQADLLFKVISQRYETKSTIVTTNRPLRRRQQVPATGRSVASDYVYAIAFDGDRVRHMTEICNDGHALKRLG